MNIIPQDTIINREFRESQNGHRSATLWFTGLSGSGKSTLATHAEEILAMKGIKTYLLDGDTIRAGLNKDLDFSDNGRTENIRRIAEVAKMLNEAGIVVLTALISPFAQGRQQARDIVSDASFFEIHVDCPLEVCESRDVKGLYKKARKGEIPFFTGISSPYESPENPELKVNTHLEDINSGSNRIVDYILPRITLG